MKEFENHHHYSEQNGHKERNDWSRKLVAMERQGLTIEQVHLIKQKMRHARKR